MIVSANPDATAIHMAGDTIHAAFQRSVRLWPDRPFLLAPAEALGGKGPIEFTFSQAAGSVDDLADRYRSAGYGQGHRVALAMGNHPEFFLHFLALNSLGVSLVPLNDGMSDPELTQIVQLADIDLIQTWPDRLDRLSRIAGASLHVSNADARLLPRAAATPRSADDRASAGDTHDIAALLFTSGTTGAPKGCLLSNDYFLRIGDFYAGLEGYCTFHPGEDRILTPLPVTHMNALACSFMAAIKAGCCLIQLDRFHASTWWKTVRDTQATIVHYLGVMPAILLQRDDTPEAWHGHKVRFAFGAGVNPGHHAVFEERYGIPLIEAWAMSETGAAGWITANHEPRHVGMRCFGKPPAHLEWRLVDDEGRDVPDEVPGELLIRTRGEDPRRYFFSGYYRDPAATAVAWDGGWFHTGDIIKRDAQGSMFFVDRSKNIIRRSGENIAAVEVEEALMRHDKIAHCAVLPVEDEIRGEEVMALIEAEGGSLLLAEDIAAFCRDHLQYFKVPGYIAFVEALPTTASQKLLRGTIRKVGRDLLEQGQAFDLRALKRKQA